MATLNPALEPKKSKERHPFFALILILLVIAVLGNFIPSGQYVRETVDGITRVDPQSYTVIDKLYTSVSMFFESFHYGVVNTASLMSLMFFVGFGFHVLQEIKLLDTAIYKLSGTLKKVPFLVVCLILMSVFIVIMWFTGLYDLAVVFIPMVVPLALALGYDVMTGAGLVLVACAVGFTAALANPWFTGIAQPIAQLPLYSGMGYRAVCTLVLLVPSLIYIMAYAKKVKADPSKSILADTDMPYQAVDENSNLQFTPRLILAGLAFVAIFVYMIYGCLQKDFSYPQLSACFAAIGIVCALIMGKGLNDICQLMSDGMKSMFMAAAVMVFARSVLYIMDQILITDTIIYALSFVVRILPSWLAAVGIFILQTIINFFIPSGSGQAAITMPIMIPLADMAGISRQVCCLASQFGDGLSNFIWPTVGSLLAILAGTSIPYSKWVKWFLPLFLILTGVCCVLLVVAVQIGYGPF